GAMRRIRIEIQTVARSHSIKTIAMAIDDLAFQNVEELYAAVLELRKFIRRLCQGDEIGLDHQAIAFDALVSEQFILMAGARTAPLHFHALTRLDESRRVFFLEAPE